ncbi:glycosyltransferase family 39 protein, partial [Streptomyces boluensis]
MDLPRRIVRALRHAAPAIYGYVCVRLFCLLVLSLWAHRQGHGIWPLLANDWDSSWYVGIAENGYARELGTAYDANNLAFFPLYPVAVRMLSWLLPGSPASAGLLLAVVASLFAAWGVFAVGDRLHGRRVGVFLALLWAALPVGLVQWMGYTESLFTAFAAWSLYACLTGRWVWAGTLASLAGLTRPTGVALAAAVSLVALLSLRSRFSWRVLVGGALAPLGWLAYVGWVGLRLGRADGYFAVQKLWRNNIDGGVETLRRLDDHLIEDSTPELFLIMVCVTLIVSTLLYVRCALDRQPLVLLVFTGLLLAIVLGSGG